MSTRERGIVQEVSGRGVLFGTIALGGLSPNRPMPPAYMSSSADFGSGKDIRCVPISRRFSVPADEYWGQDRWQSAVRVLAVGRAVGGGGQDRCPTDNNSLQKL